MGFAAADLTQDAFLGGRVMAWQPRVGYRAATDPVLLAAAVTAHSGQSVLELGCGVGVASLCLAARVQGLALSGVERQEGYAELARKNSDGAMVVFTADLADLPAPLRQRSFDHVIANPPYFPARSGPAASDPGRAAALREETLLSVWVDTAARRLKPKGWLTMINGADRLPDILAALGGKFGAISVRPLVSRQGKPARRIIVRARKSARAPFCLLSPLVLHSGPAHLSDAGDFTPQAAGILRDGAALGWE